MVDKIWMLIAIVFFIGNALQYIVYLLSDDKEDEKPVDCLSKEEVVANIALASPTLKDPEVTLKSLVYYIGKSDN